jgi:2-oxoglutarate ferredoxin oxidoreductase subunit gamma
MAKTKIQETIICAGFGGQGIMVMGKVIAEAAMEKGFKVTWLPSYGAEVRGGTAHAMVRISSEEIGNPAVSVADAAIIMNSPSLEKFENKVKKGGLIIINTSLVAKSLERRDLDVVAAPLTGEAIKLGNVRVANMIAAGIYSAKKGLIDRATLVKVIEEMAGGRKELIPINVKAVERGMDIAEDKR